MKVTKQGLETFEMIPSIIEDYIRNIPEEIIDKRRNESAWTIKEHVYHISDVQELLLNRIKVIVTEEYPIIEPYFPDQDVKTGYKFISLDEAIENYKKYREKQMKMVDNAKERDFKKKVIHKEYTGYSLPVLINHMIFHEYWHMYRIEEIWLTKEEFFI